MKSGEVGRFYDDSRKTPRERLEYFVTQTTRLRPGHPEFYRFPFKAQSDKRLPNDMHYRLTVQGREIRKVLRRLFMEGQAMGEISKGHPDRWYASSSLVWRVCR